MLSAFDGDELKQIYAFRALHGFAVGLINIFIPVYILQQGFPMSYVFLFLLVDVGAFTLTALPTGLLLSRIGERGGLMLSYAFYIPAFLMFELLPMSLPLIVTVGVVLGIGKTLFWIPINTGFTGGSSSESRGSDYGWLMGIASFAGSIAPLIGAVILSSVGFGWLVTVSVLLVLVSSIPLLYSHQREPEEFSLSELEELRNWELDFMFLFAGVSAFSMFLILPIFVYHIVGGTLNVGWVKTLGGLSSGVFSVAMGHFSDRVDGLKLIAVGTVGSAAMLTFAPTVSTAVLAFAVSLVMGLFYRVYHVPLFSMVADIGERENTLGFYSLREVFLGLGRFVMLAVTVVVTVREGAMAGFKTAFYISAGAILVTAYLSHRVEEKVL